MLIYALLLWFAGMLFFSFVFNDRDIWAPSFVFCFGFTASALCAAIYKDRWELDLHWNTFFVLAGGVFVYVLIAAVTRVIFQKKAMYPRQNIRNEMAIEIERWKIWGFLIFQSIVIIWTIGFLSHNIGMGETFSDAVYLYEKMNKFGENADKIEKMPRMLRMIRTIVHASGYIWIYLYINQMLFKQRSGRILILLNIIACIFCDGLTGARGGAVRIILGGIFLVALLRNKKNGRRSGYKFKHIFFILLIIGLLVFSFQYVGILLGRNIAAVSPGDYIAKYLGAQIKNLDIFVRSSRQYTDQFWGSQTFIYMIRWIGEIFNIEGSTYLLTLPFQRINGFSLGNVYTTFYQYLYDFGYSGVVFLVAFMAFITQFVYERAKRATSPIDISVLFSAYLFYCAAFSFFSNKFYELIFAEAFVQIIIIWWMMRRILLRLHKSKPRRHTP